MMKKFFNCLLPSLCALTLCACSLPDEPPATVTDPAVRKIYMKALAGDGDALYKVSQMYGRGTHGFPVSSYYASIAHSDAANHGNPHAIYDDLIDRAGFIRNKLTSNNARNATYNDWEAIGDDIESLQRKMRHCSYADASTTGLEEVNECADLYDRLSHTYRYYYYKCHRCNGNGKVKVQQGSGLEKCYRCLGKGFIER